MLRSLACILATIPSHATQFSYQPSHSHFTAVPKALIGLCYIILGNSCSLNCLYVCNSGIHVWCMVIAMIHWIRHENKFRLLWIFVDVSHCRFHLFRGPLMINHICIGPLTMGLVSHQWLLFFQCLPTSIIYSDIKISHVINITIPCQVI